MRKIGCLCLICLLLLLCGCGNSLRIPEHSIPFNYIFQYHYRVDEQSATRLGKHPTHVNLHYYAIDGLPEDEFLLAKKFYFWGDSSWMLIQKEGTKNPILNHATTIVFTDQKGKVAFQMDEANTVSTFVDTYFQLPMISADQIVCDGTYDKVEMQIYTTLSCGLYYTIELFAVENTKVVACIYEATTKKDGDWPTNTVKGYVDVTTMLPQEAIALFDSP